LALPAFRQRFARVTADYRDVTERSGEPATRGQIADMAHRYHWAASQSAGRRVLEVACGTGQGLGILATRAASVVACDLDADNVAEALRTHGERFSVRVSDALSLPVEDGTVDAVVLFEAIYYLADPSAFLRECRRVLSPSGIVLLSTTNPDLFDFSPSPLSRRYYGASELALLFESSGFRPKLFGYGRTEGLPLRQRLLRPVKVAARTLGLVPRTMRGKALVRRLLFGRLPVMPRDLTSVAPPSDEPLPLGNDTPDRVHRYLYAAGELGSHP
jgi:ubiquinone/menaquinone biosynthesis C-methylase UbiE